MAPGFLAVASNPSFELSLQEFHEWYEDEHIPLRLNNLTEFLSGARYQVVSSSSVSNSNIEGKPTWLAMYEIDDASTFAKPVYTSLREKRSEREKGVMSRIDVLVRITGESIGVWSADSSEVESTGMKPGQPSTWILTHSLNAPDDDAARKWAEWIGGVMKSQSRGWAKTRVVKVLESGVSRFGKAVQRGGGDAEEITLPYYVVHEYTDDFDADFSSLSNREAEPDGCEASEYTLWMIYKAYPCLAQGNLRVLHDGYGQR